MKENFNKSIKILQCGCVKSGNYLLYRIIKSILVANNCLRSFQSSSGLREIIDNIFSDIKHFPEESQIDVLHFKDDLCFLQFPDSRCKYLPIDPKLVIEYSSFLWTHDIPTIIGKNCFRNITHKFYIVRDGRDTVNSAIHFFSSPIVLKQNPVYSISNPMKLYQNFDFFSRQVENWRDHIRAFFKVKDSYFLICFEDLVSKKKEMVEKIAHYLDLNAPIEKIVQETSFRTMKKHASNHVRKGKQGDWRQYFTPRHLQIFNEIAGEELEKLGYKIVEKM